MRAELSRARGSPADLQTPQGGAEEPGPARTGPAGDRDGPGAERGPKQRNPEPWKPQQPPQPRTPGPEGAAEGLALRRKGSEGPELRGAQ